MVYEMRISDWSSDVCSSDLAFVVFDEVQQLRTGSSSSKGAAALVFSDNAEWVLGLSATPIFGYGAEIWSIMRVIDPEVLGSWEEFIREWCSYGGNNRSEEHTSELQSLMRISYAVFCLKNKTKDNYTK